MTKNTAIALLVVWSAVALGAIALLAFALLYHYPAVQGSGDVREIYSGEWAGEAIDDVSLSWHQGNVTVRPSGDGSFHIRQTSRYDAESAAIDQTGSKLSVRQPLESWFLISWLAPSSDLEMLVPAKTYAEFQVSITSGATDIQSVNAKHINLSMTSGKLTAGDLQAASMTIRVTSGRMTITNSGADALQASLTSGNVTCDGRFPALTGKTTSGNFRLTTTEVMKSLDAKLTSGNITVAMPDNDGFALALSKTSGSFHSDFGLTAMYGDDTSFAYGSGASSGRSYTVKLTSGKFSLNKTE